MRVLFYRCFRSICWQFSLVVLASLVPSLKVNSEKALAQSQLQHQDRRYAFLASLRTPTAETRVGLKVKANIDTIGGITFIMFAIKAI